MTRSIIVQHQEELQSLCKELGLSGALSLDTEFVRERTFFIQLGIIQVASDEIEAVLDPLTISSLEPLYELLADASVKKIVHAGEQDFAALYERGNVLPKNVFDTQIASALVGYGDQISYAKLVAKVSGVQIQKLETLTDWTARPLTQSQINYSLEDVRYLAQIREHLELRLATLGRAGWEREECHRLEDVETYRLPLPREYYRRMKTGNLDSSALGVLREVAAFREDAARSRDLPRGWVLRDQALIEIARRKPHSLSALRQIRSLRSQQISKYGDDILVAVREGEQSPVDEPSRDRPRLKAPPSIESVTRLLESWLYAKADAVQIAPSMLATRSDLKSLVTGHYASELPDLAVLEGWRRELVGQDLLDILGGNQALKIDEHTQISNLPYGKERDDPLDG